MPRVASYQYARQQIKKWSEGDLDAVNAIYGLADSNQIFPCYLCGCDTAKGHRHVEHRRPVSRGGYHVADNLAIACITCNLSKGTMTEEEFRAAKG